jgi:HAD superfamily hydrolase (TIGR01509 family)
MALRALIFDVDGTLAETEEGHRQAFNEVFAEFAIPWRWDREHYRDLLRVTGGKERMLHHARTRDPQRFAVVEANIDALHRSKNARYAGWVRTSGGALRPGVRRLIEEARASGLKLAIATTTSRPNVEALLTAAFDGQGPGLFAAIVCGEDVAQKKPDPEVFWAALEKLALPPRECIAFEDSRNGLLAARAANLRVVVAPSLYSANEDFEGATLIARDLDHAIEDRPLTRETLERLAG